jgi:hypothetical protein
VPFAFLIMVVFSFLPCIAAVFTFFGNPTEEVGAIFVFLFSLGFSLFWIQGYCLISNDVRTLLLDNVDQDNENPQANHSVV